MQKFIDTIAAAGAGGVLTPLGNASVSVYLTGTTTVATIYSDNGVTSLSNPFTSTATGLVAFYAPDNRYDLVVTKAGFTPVTVADIILEDIDDSVTTDMSNAAIQTSTFNNGTITASAVQGSTFTTGTWTEGAINNATITAPTVTGGTLTQTALSAVGVTTSAITNSTVNSTPIGTSAPAPGTFSSVTFSSAVGQGTPIGFGEVRLNNTDLTLDVGLSGGVVGQMFEEAFISAVNNTAAPLVSGQVVGYNGVDNASSLPYAKLINANADQEPLNILGIATQTIPIGSLGRITTFGKVRDVNTTGFQVSQTWAQGDLLYVHPTLVGELTNVEPTTPFQSILVAKVLRVGATTGTLMVRPLLQHHKHYGVFNADGVYGPIGTGDIISLPWDIEFESGVDVDVQEDMTKVFVRRAGLYTLDFSGQLRSSSSSSGQRATLWLRINGVDKPYSAGEFEVKNVANAVVWHKALQLAKDDYVQIMMATTNSQVYFGGTFATAQIPAARSIRLTVTQVN